MFPEGSINLWHRDKTKKSAFEDNQYLKAIVEYIRKYESELVITSVSYNQLTIERYDRSNSYNIIFEEVSKDIPLFTLVTTVVTALGEYHPEFVFNSVDEVITYLSKPTATESD